MLNTFKLPVLLHHPSLGEAALKTVGEVGLNTISYRFSSRTHPLTPLQIGGRRGPQHGAGRRTAVGPDSAHATG
jgi:hypothetical protein